MAATVSEGARSMRTPREVVEMYNYELWNNRRFELAEELIGDCVIRHEIGQVQSLTHEQARQRVIDTWAMVERMEFILHRVVAEGELVTILYECVAQVKDAPEQSVSSIEVFRVVEGRICEVWNVPKTAGRWH